METIVSDEAISLNPATPDKFEATNREELANFYLKKHKIVELLHHITAELVYRCPDDPHAFIADYLEKLRNARQTHSDYPSLFDETNVRSLFGIMDPAGNGHINHAQFKAGMENLGVDQYERNPPGSAEEHITLNTFMTIANEGLAETSASFTK